MSSEDLDTWLSTAKLGAAAWFFLWAASVAVIRRPGWILAGTVGWCLYLWGITELPLSRLYALGVGQDRLNNLALCTPVAAGSPFYETHQVGQLNFEPFWSLLVAALSGFSPERVQAVYTYVPLAVMAAFAVSLYFSLRPPRAVMGEDAWSGWERAFAVYFALMLSTSPFDSADRLRSTWNLSFLLKPNHALGLVLTPPLLALFARIETWRGRIAAGALLHLLGWVFVLHWVYVSAGLVLYAGLTWRLGRSAWHKSLADVGVALGINLLIVSPYLYMLLAGYPFLVTGPAFTLPSVGAHLLQPTLDQGVVFFLALWGGLKLHRRRDDLSRLWLALALAALGIWVAYLGLSVLQNAREVDEVYYFLRIVSATLAGVGAWDLTQKLAEVKRIPERVLPTGLLLLSFPLAVPAWWNPKEMDPYFAGSLEPLPKELVAVMDFVRAHTPPGVAFLAGREFSRYVAALGARRVVYDKFFHSPPGVSERREWERALLLEGSLEAARALRERFGARYVLLGRDLLTQYPGLSRAGLSERPGWKEVFTTGETNEALSVFEFEPESMRDR